MPVDAGPPLGVGVGGANAAAWPCAGNTYSNDDNNNNNNNIIMMIIIVLVTSK